MHVKLKKKYVLSDFVFLLSNQFSVSSLADAADDGDDPLPVPRLIPELLVHFSLTNLSYWYRNKDIMGNDLLRFRGVEQRWANGV